MFDVVGGEAAYYDDDGDAVMEDTECAKGRLLPRQRTVEEELQACEDMLEQVRDDGQQYLGYQPDVEERCGSAT